MDSTPFRHIYGPVPSRRLGRSLGIDLVPFKVCSYDCVYCQLGRTTVKTIERKEYEEVEEIIAEVKQALDSGSSPDVITLAGSGEPTLNSGIGDLIGKLKSLTKVPIAVLTNGSLLWMSEVQEALLEADYVLPSLDAGDERLFHWVNRPHREISFERMIEGTAEFTRRFAGEVWLEVMLLGGVTGLPAEAKKIDSIVRRINPSRVQLNTAVRPTAEEYAFQLPNNQLEALASHFSGRVEVIAKYERNEILDQTARTVSDEDVLSLLERRPCTVQDIAAGLTMIPNEVLKRLDVLSRKGAVKTVRRDGKAYYERTDVE